jgi:hypothetical protein
MISSAACSPKNFATVRTSFLPSPAVRNRTSTITTLMTTNAIRDHRATTIGGTVVRNARWLVATIVTSVTSRVTQYVRIGHAAESHPGKETRVESGRLIGS